MVDCSFEVVPFPEEYNLSKQASNNEALPRRGGQLHQIEPQWSAGIEHLSVSVILRI